MALGFGEKERGAYYNYKLTWISKTAYLNSP